MEELNLKISAEFLKPHGVAFYVTGKTGERTGPFIGVTRAKEVLVGVLYSLEYSVLESSCQDPNMD